MFLLPFFLPENKKSDFGYQNPMLAKLKDKSFISYFVGSDISLFGKFYSPFKTAEGNITVRSIIKLRSNITRLWRIKLGHLPYGGCPKGGFLIKVFYAEAICRQSIYQHTNRVNTFCCKNGYIIINKKSSCSIKII